MAGEDGSIIAFDTSGQIASDANKSQQVYALRGQNYVNAGDTYWHVGTDRVWKWSGSAWVAIARVSNYNPAIAGSSNVETFFMDAVNNRVDIRDSNGILRVRLGKLT